MIAAEPDSPLKGCPGGSFKRSEKIQTYRPALVRKFEADMCSNRKGGFVALSAEAGLSQSSNTENIFLKRCFV